MDQRHPLKDSTLAELREIVHAARDMPANSMVRVRTHGGWSADGALLKRVLIIASDPVAVDEDEDPDAGPQPGSLFTPAAHVE
jgi:hypothetical protein